ncbi:hypothetical protein B0H14DRAFT_2982701 [Mycena olivaceomarginata]|nr:hypothetical protein B0H14DRAFT_2982701 [Mycena olivaceomarginata]
MLHTAALPLLLLVGGTTRTAPCSYSVCAPCGPRSPLPPRRSQPAYSLRPYTTPVAVPLAHQCDAAPGTGWQ